MFVWGAQLQIGWGDIFDVIVVAECAVIARQIMRAKHPKSHVVSFYLLQD